MKRIIILMAVVLIATVFVGCADAKVPPSTATQATQTTTNTESETKTQSKNETTATSTEADAPTSPTAPQGAITSEEAVSIALKKAGVSQDALIGMWAELDYDNGVAVYEVDFSDGIYDYECDIDAMTGKILSYDKEIDD